MLRPGHRLRQQLSVLQAASAAPATRRSGLARATRARRVFEAVLRLRRVGISPHNRFVAAPRRLRSSWDCVGAAKRGPPPQRLEEERLGGGAPPVRGGAGEGPRRRERRRGRLRAFRGRRRGDRTRGRGLPRVAADRLVVRRVAAQRTRTIFDAARSRARNSRATGPGSTTSSTPSTPSRARPVPVRPTVDRASPPPRAYLASLVHMRLAGPVFGELVSAAGCQTRRILLRRPRSVALKGPGLRASLQRSGPDRAPFFFWAGDFYPSGREGCQPPVGFFGCLRPPATRRIFKVCFLEKKSWRGGGFPRMRA